MPVPGEDGRKRLPGCRNGEPKLGGITPIPPEADIRRMPPPLPMPFEDEPGWSAKERLPPMPPPIRLIPPMESIDKDSREVFMAAVGRDRNESPAPFMLGSMEVPNPPPMGTRTFPPMPPESTMIEPPPMEEPDPPDMAPYPPNETGLTEPCAKAEEGARPHPQKRPLATISKERFFMESSAVRYGEQPVVGQIQCILQMNLAAPPGAMQSSEKRSNQDCKFSSTIRASYLGIIDKPAASCADLSACCVLASIGDVRKSTPYSSDPTRPTISRPGLLATRALSNGPTTVTADVGRQDCENTRIL